MIQNCRTEWNRLLLLFIANLSGHFSWPWGLLSWPMNLFPRQKKRWVVQKISVIEFNFFSLPSFFPLKINIRQTFLKNSLTRSLKCYVIWFMNEHLFVVSQVSSRYFKILQLILDKTLYQSITLLETFWLFR